MMAPLTWQGIEHLGQQRVSRRASSSQVAIIVYVLFLVANICGDAFPEVASLDEPAIANQSDPAGAPHGHWLPPARGVSMSWAALLPGVAGDGCRDRMYKRD